jgi:arsenate reductase (thioredoxin)
VPELVSKRRVLFLCTHNSASSQMAEGLLRDLCGDRFEPFSAGTEATHVRPLAFDVLGSFVLDPETLPAPASMSSSSTAT